MATTPREGRRSSRRPILVGIGLMALLTLAVGTWYYSRVTRLADHKASLYAALLAHCADNPACAKRVEQRFADCYFQARIEAPRGQDDGFFHPLPERAPVEACIVDAEARRDSRKLVPCVFAVHRGVQVEDAALPHELAKAPPAPPPLDPPARPSQEAVAHWRKCAAGQAEGSVGCVARLAAHDWNAARHLAATYFEPHRALAPDYLQPVLAHGGVDAFAKSLEELGLWPTDATREHAPRSGTALALAQAYGTAIKLEAEPLDAYTPDRRRRFDRLRALVAPRLDDTRLKLEAPATADSGSTAHVYMAAKRFTATIHRRESDSDRARTLDLLGLVNVLLDATGDGDPRRLVLVSADGWTLYTAPKTLASLTAAKLMYCTGER